MKIDMKYVISLLLLVATILIIYKYVSGIQENFYQEGSDAAGQDCSQYDCSGPGYDKCYSIGDDRYKCAMANGRWVMDDSKKCCGTWNAEGRYWTGGNPLVQDTAGQDTTGQDTTGQDTMGQDTTRQDTAGQDQDGQGQDQDGQGQIGQDTTTPSSFPCRSFANIMTEYRDQLRLEDERKQEAMLAEQRAADQAARAGVTTLTPQAGVTTPTTRVELTCPPIPPISRVEDKIYTLPPTIFDKTPDIPPNLCITYTRMDGKIEEICMDNKDSKQFHINKNKELNNIVSAKCSDVQKLELVTDTEGVEVLPNEYGKKYHKYVNKACPSADDGGLDPNHTYITGNVISECNNYNNCRKYDGTIEGCAKICNNSLECKHFNYTTQKPISADESAGTSTNLKSLAQCDIFHTKCDLKTYSPDEGELSRFNYKKTYKTLLEEQKDREKLDERAMKSVMAREQRTRLISPQTTSPPQTTTTPVTANST